MPRPTRLATLLLHWMHSAITGLTQAQESILINADILAEQRQRACDVWWSQEDIGETGLWLLGAIGRTSWIIWWTIRFRVLSRLILHFIISTAVNGQPTSSTVPDHHRARSTLNRNCDKCRATPLGNRRAGPARQLAWLKRQSHWST